MRRSQEGEDLEKGPLPEKPLDTAEPPPPNMKDMEIMMIVLVALLGPDFDLGQYQLLFSLFAPMVLQMVLLVDTITVITLVKYLLLG